MGCRRLSTARWIKSILPGAFRFCAAAFGVKEEVESNRIPLLGEYEGHPSIRKLVSRAIRSNLATTCFTYTFPIHWTKTLSGQQGDNEAPRGQLCGVWPKTAKEWARHATSPAYAGRRHCSSDRDRSQQCRLGEGRITEVAGVFKTPPLSKDGLNQSPPAYARTIHLQLFG